MSTALTEATESHRRHVSIPVDTPATLAAKLTGLRRSVSRHVCEFVLVMRTVAKPNEHCGCLGAPIFERSYKLGELVGGELEPDLSFPTMSFAISEHGQADARSGSLSLSPEDWLLWSRSTPGKEDVAIIVGTAAIDEYVARNGDHHLLYAMLRKIRLPIHAFPTCDMLVRESTVEGNI